MYKDSKIYVAGHTGLLGAALMKKLAGDGYDNIITRSHSELDLTDKSGVSDFFLNEKPEYVFLAAGKVGGIVSNNREPAEYLHTNLAIQDNVFEAAQECEVKHLIFYGSSCCYPKVCRQPMKEEYLLTGLPEETSEGYAAAKTAGIIGCRAYNNQYNTNRFIALVPCSMYGPNDNFDVENSHVLSALLRRFHEAKINNARGVTLWGSGKPRREFIFCEDAAAASVFAMENADRLENRHYNMGTGIDYSIKELAAITAEAVGFGGKILWDRSRPDGSPAKLLDSSKFSSFGWRPAISIEEGLRRTYQWYQEQSLAHTAT
jgi:GDP-L-fucose synthase